MSTEMKNKRCDSFLLFVVEKRLEEFVSLNLMEEPM